MRILLLGCKEWPYGCSVGHEVFIGGGTAKYIKNLAYGLEKEGCKIDIITRHFPGQKKNENENNIHIRRVFFINNFIARLPSFTFFSFFVGINIAYKADVIHGHGLFGGISAVALARISRKPCIITPHGMASHRNKKLGQIIIRLLGFLERYCYRKADTIVFLSGNERDTIRNKIKLHDKACRVIESAIELPDITQKKKNGDAKISVLFVGRLVDGKGLDEFIDSYMLLPIEIRKNIEYVIVGDGYLRKLLQKKVRKIGAGDNIKFTGFQKDPSRFYANSDIYVLPSTHEGFPLALLEAMSWGIPCLINDFGVPIPRDTILVMPDNSPYTLAEYIKRLALNPDYREILSAKSRRLIENRFSIDRLVREYITCYNMQI